MNGMRMVLNAFSSDNFFTAATEGWNNHFYVPGEVDTEGWNNHFYVAGEVGTEGWNNHFYAV